MREARFGLKAATVTPEGADDVGSPNRILREAIDGKVIIRTGRRIPGVTPVAGVHYPIAVVRMAVGDAYGAEQWREEEDGDEIAYRTERISRSVCRAVAEYSFRTAERDPRARLRRAEVDRQPGLRGDAQGGDGRRRRAPPGGALLPRADRRDLRRADLGRRRRAAVIPALNRDGDCLSDLVMPLFGSIAGAESVLLALRRRLRAARGDGRGAARHRAGAAGQGHRQPDGDDPRGRGGAALRAARQTASRAIYESVLEATATGVRTPDLGGHAATTEFTDEVIARVRTKIDIWASL